MTRWGFLLEFFAPGYTLDIPWINPNTPFLEKSKKAVGILE